MHLVGRAALGLVAVVAAAGGALAQPLGMPGTGGCNRYQAEFPALIGLTEAEAVTALERMTGIRTVRIAGPGTPLILNFRPERATILLRDGKVEQILCG